MNMIPILLVDDIVEYLDTMELHLPEGCIAIRASTLAEAKEQVIATRPAVAVVDIRLKECEKTNHDGLDFLKWVRCNHSELLVIMISAYREFEFKAKSLALGAEYFLEKPIEPEKFRQTVMKAMENI